MTPTEEAVAAAYGDILGLTGLQPKDDLFALGGDSLQAVQIALRLEKRFDIAIPLEALEISGRIEEVATWIDAELAKGPVPG